MSEVINLINKIPSNERDLIREYIFNYAVDEGDTSYKMTERFAGIEKILTPWSNAKHNLYKLLGNRLTLSKDVNFNVSEDSLIMEINHYRDGEYNPIANFIRRYRDALCDKYSNIYQNERKKSYEDFKRLHYTLSYFISETALATNRVGEDDFILYKIPTPDGKFISFTPDTKITKILSKMSTILDIDGYEEFRIFHSQILNKKGIRGKLILSIHPLDFMTMSDNNCKWESCMSWMANGCYRQGTVEMMNSPHVLVAYVDSDKPMHLFDEDTENDEWSNKKLRCLFIITNEFITKIKSYPYQHEEFEKEVINWIADLSVKNLGIHYEPDFVEIKANSENNILYKGEELSLTFCTNYMYNDFGTTTSYARLNDNIFNIDTKNLSFCYSGESECMWCGDTNISFDDGSYLICNDCYNRHYCSNCGDRLTEDEIESYTLNSGEQFCEYCFDNYCTKDILTGEYCLQSDRFEVFVVKSAERIKEVIKTLKCRPYNFKDFYALFKNTDCYSFWIPWQTEEAKKYCNTDKIILFEGTCLFDRDIRIIDYDDCCDIIQNHYNDMNYVASLVNTARIIMYEKYENDKSIKEIYPQLSIKSKDWRGRVASGLLRLDILSPDIYNILFDENDLN